ncbi:uncharacterized protein LOC117343058 [Pecten maximus]|uniref:uncharacterized protein LOC117343058 n=1 Tax=Pecten maximus TaxID=6579 RepID=UPI001458565A|nr:uncharacterized protein LOC117343058 [Pecten maximus]
MSEGLALLNVDKSDMDIMDLKKIFFDVKIPNVITSYIIKTTLFWTIEETPPDLWQPHKLLTAVKACLDRLTTFIQNDFCPHYFIKTCNLLIRRYSSDDKKRVLETCLEAKGNPMEFLLKTPLLQRELRQEKASYENTDGLMKRKNRVEGTVMYACVHYVFRMTVSGFTSKQELTKYCRTVQKRIDTVINKFEYFENKEIMQKCVRDVTERLLEICRKKDSDDNDIDIEDLNSIANTCHLQMVARSYIRCNDLLIKFLQVQKCRAYKKMINLDIFELADVFVSRLMFNVFNAFTDDKTPLISDMIFVQIERDSLPTPLQTELNSPLLSITEPLIQSQHKGTVLVDPLVYVCFLRFWCSMKLDQNIEKLKARADMVWCCSLANISEKAVALNLLAYCHIQLEEYEKAFAVLCRAFREKPVKYSTLVHIATLVSNRVNRPRD